VVEHLDLEELTGPDQIARHLDVGLRGPHPFLLQTDCYAPRSRGLETGDSLRNTYELQSFF
jgi:hypothetical protein